MDSPRAHSLELRTEWDGDLGLVCARIHVIVHVYARPGSSFMILPDLDGLYLRDPESYTCLTEYVGPASSDHDSSSLKEKGQEKAENAAGISQLLQRVQDDSAAYEDGRSDGQTTIKAKHDVTPTAKPSKIPKRKLDFDGASDDLNSLESLRDRDRDSDTDTLHDETYSNDFEFNLPPSPSPSSQDLIPWTSTRDIESRIGPAYKESSAEISDSYIRPHDGDLVFFVSEHGKEGLYRVEVVSPEFMNENAEGWYTLDLSDVIAACPNVVGKFVLDIPRDDSKFEHRLSGLDVVKGSDGCFEASFDPRDRPFVFFQLRERVKGDIDVDTPVGETASDQGDIHTPEHAHSSGHGNSIEPTEELIHGEDTGEEVHTLVASETGDIHSERAHAESGNSIQPAEPEVSKVEEKETSPTVDGEPAKPANTLRQQFISTLQWLLPALFICTMIICTTIGAPAEIATPGNTICTVKSYAIHLRAWGSSLQAVNGSQRGWSGLYRYIVDRDSDYLQAPSVVPDELVDASSPEVHENDDDLGLEVCFLPWAGPVDYRGPVCPSMIDNKAAPKANDSSSNTTSSTKDSSKPPRDKPVPLSTHISSLAVDLFRHVACSTSTACTMAKVGEYKKPTWEVFERYYCGENGDWRPTTIRDRVDYLFGWTPPECWEE
jgi:hypothetical protein